ncbi:MAG: hypothetical protein ACI4N4_05860 [Candidatus Fimenecus sp.]
MKKFLCALFCLLLLCGCGINKTKDVEKEPLNISGFNTDVHTTLNGITVSAEADYTAFDSLVLTFTQPQTVKGVQVSCADGEYTLKTNRLTFSISEGKLPYNMIFCALESCINNVNGAAPEKGENSESLSYSYEAQGHFCTLLVNPDTKEFEKLIIDGTDAAVFENFTYKTN